MKEMLLVPGATLTSFAFFGGLLVSESLPPTPIDWDAKNAFARCEGAAAGTLPWPPDPGRACAAMLMCANEAHLDAAHYAGLVTAMRRLPRCGDP